MLSRLLLLLFTFVSGRLFKTNLPSDVGQTTGDALKKVVLGLAVYGGLMIVFAAGLALTLVDLYDVYRQQQVIGLTPLALVSVPMFLVPALALVVVAMTMSFRAAKAQREKEAAAHASVLSPIIDALAEIIHGYAAEQKVKRYNAETERPSRDANVTTPFYAQEVPPAPRYPNDVQAVM